MNKIVGIFRNMQQADRLLNALEEMGIDKAALNTFSRPRVEIENVEDDLPDEIMVTVYVREERQNEVETIFNNSDATQVNVWDKDREPETLWSPILYARTSNS